MYTVHSVWYIIYEQLTLVREAAKNIFSDPTTYPLELGGHIYFRNFFRDSKNVLFLSGQATKKITFFEVSLRSYMKIMFVFVKIHDN